MNTSRRLLHSFACIVAVLAVPPVVFFITGLVSGMSLGDLSEALIVQYGDERPNLLVTGVIGLLPLGVMGLVIWLHRRLRGQYGNYLFWGGLIPLVVVVAWSNHEFWRVFLPERSAPGFPHGLELIIGPVVFAPVAMVAGMLIAWLIGRSRS